MIYSILCKMVTLEHKIKWSNIAYGSKGVVSP
jgi:hypothetical protein